MGCLCAPSHAAIVNITFDASIGAAKHCYALLVQFVVLFCASMSTSSRRSARSSLTAAPPSLPVIDEMATSSGNAFAQKEIEKERYQLAGNAFAQQQFAERKMTPPGVTHPAFRKGFNLLDTTKPIPELDSPDRRRGIEHHQRESSQTTMTQFIQPSPELRTQSLRPSPELNLGTTPDQTPIPTQREWLETREHLEMHGNQQLHIPVFKHTPKDTAAEFATAVAGSTPNKNDTNTRPQTPATKSPKKGFFERMSKWTGRRSQGPQTPKQNTEPERLSGSHLPPKARAVLQAAPPPRSVVRSPSKTKSFFSRQPSDLNAKRLDPPRAATSLGHRTPQTVHFATPRSSAQESRNVSQATATHRTPTLSRSQSLKYLDQTIPPTPPAKDTPPDELAIRNISSQRPFVPFANETPSRTTGFVSTSGRLSPTRLGSYGNRGAAKLVTQTSVYSMRASVVPDAMNKEDFDDAKARIGGLGIEGFDLPHETKRASENIVTYSPSVYSPDALRSSVAKFPDRAARLSASEKWLPQLSTEDRLGPMHLRGSPDTAQSSVSDTGTIPVVYPELARDPSIQSFMTPDPVSPSPQPGATVQAFNEVEKILNVKVDSPIETPEQRRSSTTSTIRGDYTIASPTSTRSELSADGLFAIALNRLHGDKDTPSATPPGRASLERTPIEQPPPETPSTIRPSPMASHPSAMPSPLHINGGHLLPSTYTPTQPRSRKEAKKSLKISKVEEQELRDELMSPYDPPWTPGGRPKPKEDIFKNRPSFVPPVEENLVVRRSPPVRGTRWSEDPAPPVGDPKKPASIRKVSPGKSVVETAVAAIEKQGPQTPLPEEPDGVEVGNILEIINDRDEKIRELHEEMKTENTRLHHRLASIEIQDRRRASKPDVCYGESGKRRESPRGRASNIATQKGRASSSTQTDSSKTSSVERRPAKHRANQEMKRISTTFAHDYYQKHQSSSGETSPVDSVPESERLTTIITPSLAQLCQTIPDLSRPSEQPLQDSPTLPASFPAPAVPELSTSGVPIGDTRYGELMAVMQEQQAMMLQMMQEIRELKRANSATGDKS